jgi:hypothetical protein
MGHIKNFLNRFSERAPFLYFLIVGIGGGWLLVFVAGSLLVLIGSEECSWFFRNVPHGLGLLWIIWQVFKYALRPLN